MLLLRVSRLHRKERHKIAVLLTSTTRLDQMMQNVARGLGNCADSGHPSDGGAAASLLRGAESKLIQNIICDGWRLAVARRNPVDPARAGRAGPEAGSAKEGLFYAARRRETTPDENGALGSGWAFLA